MSGPVTGRAPGATTGIGGVIGDPVRHSLSPALHNAAYAALGLDLAYGAFHVPAGAARQALLGARDLGFFGLSVTTPHKDAIALAADQRSPLVERLGAANTVVFEAGVSIAESTDGEGFVADLRLEAGLEPEGLVVGLIGAGGAARAVALALVEAGVGSLLVVNRSAARAEALVALCGGAARTAALEELAACRLVVNATSTGLAGDDGGDAAARRLATPLRAGQLAYDLVYRPALPAFLDEAARRGASVRNGLGMLVHQAAGQVARFTGSEPPLEAMWAAVAEDAALAPAAGARPVPRGRPR